MNFTGRTWRPPYEASSFIIQAAAGCTYNKCRFCSLYKGECYRMSPLSEWEEDLQELSLYHPNARRIFWTGANPFAMSYENLKARALSVYDYLKECQTMAMFASIRDIKPKKVKQLRTLADKGYTAKDIIDQCRKLDEAGIEYYFVYMTGLAGKGNGYQNAVNSAKVFSKVNPRFISVDSLPLFEDTELLEMAERGEFVPAGEKERIEELQVFIQNLRLKVHLFADSISNFYPVTAYLPRDKELVIGELQNIMDTVSEEEMLAYRRNLKALG